MPVAATHPLVADYLARLDAASAGLPPARRAELRADLEAHLADAVPGTPDETTVREALDRLGDPADIVAAELEAGPGGRPSSPPYAPPYGAPYGAAHEPTGAPPGPRSPWGPLEVGAVALLTVGCFLLPVVGPAIGIVLAWISQRWTRREKVVATAWTVLPVVVLVLGAAALFTVRTTGSSEPAPEFTQSVVEVTP